VSRFRIRPPGSKKAGLAAGLGVTMGAGVAFLGNASPHDALFLLGFGAFSSVCVLLIVGARSSDSLSPAPLFGLICFLLFGIGAAYQEVGLDPDKSHPDTLIGLLMALEAVGAFAFGYWVGGNRKVPRPAARLPRWHPGRAFAAGCVCFVIGVAGSAAYFSSGEYFFGTRSGLSLDVTSTLAYVQGFLFIGLSIMAISAYATESRFRRIVVAACAVGSVLALLPTGRRYYLLFVLTSVAIPWHYYRRRIGLKPIILGISAAVIFLYPIGQIYRSQVALNQSSTPIQIPQTIAATLGQTVSLGPIGYFAYSADKFQRLNQAGTLTALRNAVPNKIGYKYGQTFLPGVIWVIPRLVWHDKPTFQFYNDVGRATGILAPDNFDTAVVYTSVGELYLDFGDLGILVGMLVYGLLFSLLYRLLVSSPPNETAVFAYSALVVPFWSVEEALGPALSGSLRAIATGLIILLLVGALRRQTRTSVAVPSLRWAAQES
jgi:hypothetical protein